MHRPTKQTIHVQPSWIQRSLGYFILAIIFIIFYILNQQLAKQLPHQTTYAEYPNETIYQAKVDQITDQTTETIEQTPYIKQSLTLTILNGDRKGEILNNITNQVPSYSQQILTTQDKVILGALQDETGDFYYIIDRYRGDIVLIAIAMFLITLTLVIGKETLPSLIGLTISFYVLIQLITPFITYGYSPIIITIIGTLIIIPFTFYISHGFNSKTTVSVIATLSTLAIMSLISTWFVTQAHLSNLSTESLLTLLTIPELQFNFQGLLIAGIIISALGILDDVTISQASVVEQLHKTKTFTSFKNLYTQSLRVGKDHIASAINTLILVYAGASLPTLLLLTRYPRPNTVLFNNELIVSEILIAILSTMAIIIAIPITTALASGYYLKKE